MINKISVPVGKICIFVLLTLGLFICSCKKPKPSEESPSQKSSGEQAPQDVNKPKGGDVNAVADACASVPLDIKLPKPMFVGTPQSINVPNMEKPRVGPRPQILVPQGVTNVALGKPVSSTDQAPIIGELTMITDGDKEAADGSYVELGPLVQSVTIDLQAEYNIYAIVVWHYHKQARVFFDVVVQVADDPDFITNVKTLFNNDNDNSSGLGIGKDLYYIETSEGKLIDAKGVQGRYVRLYSKGNNSDDTNYYIEVEVFGKPAK